MLAVSFGPVNEARGSARAAGVLWAGSNWRDSGRNLHASGTTVTSGSIPRANSSRNPWSGRNQIASRAARMPPTE